MPKQREPSNLKWNFNFGCNIIGSIRKKKKKFAIPLNKLANWVFPPDADKTELREKEAVSGMQPKKEQKIDPAPTAIISWVESVFFPLPVEIAQYNKSICCKKLRQLINKKLTLITERFGDGNLFQNGNDWNQNHSRSHVSQDFGKCNHFIGGFIARVTVRPVIGWREFLVGSLESERRNLEIWNATFDFACCFAIKYCQLPAGGVVMFKFKKRYSPSNWNGRCP